MNKKPEKSMIKFYFCCDHCGEMFEVEAEGWDEAHKKIIKIRCCGKKRGGKK